MALRTRLLLIILTLALALGAGVAASFWALSMQGKGVAAGIEAGAQLRWAQAVREPVSAAQIAPEADEQRQAVRAALRACQMPERGAVPASTAPVIEAALQEALAAIDGARDPDMALRGVLELIEAAEVSAEAEQLRLQRNWPSARRSAVGGLLTVVLITLTLAALAVWSHFVSIRSSFRKLNERVQRIASGRINERLPDEVSDKELAELSKNINLVAERLHGLVIGLEERVRVQSTALARAERLASVGFLAAGVAHEINNPLAVITGEAELLNGEKLPPQAAEAIAVIREEAFRCKKITKRLLKLSTPGGAEAEAVDCRKVAAGILRNARTIAKERGARLVCQVPKGLVIYADRIEIKQVLLNLVVNAIEAGAKTVRVVGVLDTERIGMAVLDDGRGLEAEQLLRVFEPFYTTKTGSPGTGGTGLGLALAYAIIEQSDGLLEAFSDGPNKGCRFVISWPKQLQEQQAVASQQRVESLALEEALATVGGNEDAEAPAEPDAPTDAGDQPFAFGDPDDSGLLGSLEDAFGDITSTPSNQANPDGRDGSLDHGGTHADLGDPRRD